SARATSRRVSSSGARPARLRTNSRSGSTLSEPTRHRHIPKRTVRRKTAASPTAARPAPQSAEPPAFRRRPRAAVCGYFALKRAAVCIIAVRVRCRSTSAGSSRRDDAYGTGITSHRRRHDQVLDDDDVLATLAAPAAAERALGEDTGARNAIRSPVGRPIQHPPPPPDRTPPRRGGTRIPPRPPRHRHLPEHPRPRLRGGGRPRSRDTAVRTHPRRPRTTAQPRPPRHLGRSQR